MTFDHSIYSPKDETASAASIEFYTPPNIVEAARATMGGIDLDPASCAEANEVVKARDYYGKADDGLSRAWTRYRSGSDEGPARIFLNPPGGKVGKRSAAVVWWEKLYEEWLDGNVEQAVFVCFNLEVLNTTQASPVACLDFPVCYFRVRPRFWPPGTPPELRGKSGSPKYPGCVVYVPPIVESGGGRSDTEILKEHTDRFREAFAPLGRVVVPA